MTTETCPVSEASPTSGAQKTPWRSIRTIAFLGAGLVAWWLVYGQLMNLAKWITFQVFPLSAETHLGSAVLFFIYEVPKVLMLLLLVVFGVGIIR